MITQSTKDYFATRYKIDNETGCWLWLGLPTKDGYGQIGVRGVNYRAHRLSYTIHKDEIPDGLFVCHQCDNPLCVNPNHLFLGTQQDNVNDEVAKKRHVHGFNHYRSKLNNVDIDIMVHLLSKGFTHQYIGKKLGISTSNVHGIANGICRKEFREIMLQANTKPKELIDSPAERLYWIRSPQGWRQFKRRKENQHTHVQKNKSCGNCGEIFIPKRNIALYCSDSCAAKAFRKRNPGRKIKK